MQANRRTLIKGAAAGAGLLGAGRGLAQAGGEVRVGLLTVKTGPLASGGIDMERGLAMYLAERNGMLAGRKVNVIVADTGGVPATARTKTQELVERNKVHLLMGPLAAFEALAIDDYIKAQGVPTLSVAAAEDMTQRKPNPWFVRAVGTSAQPNHPLGEYAAKTLKYKRIAIVADDFAFGHEIAAGFQRAFEDNGGKVVQKLFSPLNVADYGTYIGQVKPNVDAVLAAFAGGNGIKFLRQYNEYGLKAKIPLLASMTTVDEGILKSMGDEALGVISSGWYSAAIDNPANKKFVADVNRDYKQDPGYYSIGAYGAALMLEEAVKAVKGKVEDKAAFMAALRNVQVAGDPRGKLTLDALGNPVMDVQIRKVERKDGKLVNSVVKVYPGVTQFWTYGRKEFLASPVYSRDYPPATNLEK